MALKKPANVIYFAAVMYDRRKISSPEDILSEIFSPLGMKSECFAFDHTAYYEPEMGNDLSKYFISFGSPAEPAYLPSYKLKAIEMENKLSENSKRIINIDPGYLATEKIVVASTKNFTHRIYLSDGIFGDLQLMRRKGIYKAMPWTYADYIRPEALEFFNKLYETHRDTFQQLS